MKRLLEIIRADAAPFLSFPLHKQIRLLKEMRHPSIEITQKSLWVLTLSTLLTQYNSEKDLFFPYSVTEGKDANILTE